jgi:hypothetical protein
MMRIMAMRTKAAVAADPSDDALDEQQQPAGLPQKRFGAAVLGLRDPPVPGVPTTHPMLVSLLWETMVAPLVEMLRDTAAATVAACAQRIPPNGPTQRT